MGLTRRDTSVARASRAQEAEDDSARAGGSLVADEGGERRASISIDCGVTDLLHLQRVFKALDSVKEYAPPAAHDALEMGTELLRFAPVAGLAEAARVLLTIWNSLQLVEVRSLSY